MKSIFDYQETQHLNVNYTEMLEYIYHKNKGSKIFIDAKSIKTSKELFRFALDLFCKGLIFCHGGPSNKVEIDSLSLEQIQVVIDKLSYTGIMTIIQVIKKDPNHEHEHDDEDSSNNESPLLCKDEDMVQCAYHILNDSVKRIDNYPDNDDLKNYIFKIKIGDSIFCICFDVRV